jgi:hypothetical protein
LEKISSSTEISDERKHNLIITKVKILSKWRQVECGGKTGDNWLDK